MISLVTIKSPYGELKECLSLSNSGSTELAYNFGDILKISGDYTFSCWMKADKTTQIKVQISNNLSDNFSITTDWTKIVYTAKADVSKSKTVLFSVPVGITLYAFEGMLESGNTPSDFKPNEEDLENVVTTLQTSFKIEQGKISELIKETTIDNDDGTTSSLKDKYLETVKTVDGMKTTIGDIQTTQSSISGKVTEIEATTEGIKTNVSDVKSTADSAKSTAEQTATKFNWLVKSGTSSTDFTLTDRTAQLVADSINLHGLVTFKGLDSSTQNKINDANSKIDNLQIGGRNLIKKSDILSVNCSVDTSDFVGNGKIIIANPDEYGGVYLLAGDMGIEPNSTYILHYNLQKIDGKLLSIGGHTDPTFVNSFFSVNDVFVGTYPSQYPLNDSSQVFKIEVIINTPNVVDKEDRIYIQPNRAYIEEVVASVTKLKLENGNKATDWSPAPEDKVNQSIINNWAKDSVVDGETIINGGYIQANTIGVSQLAVGDIFATGTSVMNIINAQHIDASRITTGQLNANRINAYGLTIVNKNTNQQTFDISTDGEVTMRGSVSSYDYNSGKTGWTINNDGTAEFNDIITRGSVITNDGGIVSSGGTGRNLLLNSNFSKSYTGNSFTVNNITYNTYAKGYGGYNGGINNPKTNYHAYLDTKTNHIVFDETNGSRNWKGIVPDGDTFPALVGKNITSLTLSMQTKASDSGTYVFGGFYYIKKGGTIRDFHAGQFEKFPPKGETRISTAIELGSDVDWSKGVDLYIYGYNFSTNSKLEIWDLKLEEGTVATPWSPAPEDKLKQVRFWAGGSYDERESAPWIVYSDGSMKATQGEFSGVFSGTVDIGNIKIADPSSTAGNDALLTIQNGSNGIKRVQLTDSNSSIFAQDLIISNNTYSPMVTLKQDGTALFDRGINIGDSKDNANNVILNKTSLIISNKELTTTSTGFLINSNLDVGSSNDIAHLTVHGDTISDSITLTNELNFGGVVKFTTTSNGINIDFVE